MHTYNLQTFFSLSQGNIHFVFLSSLGFRIFPSKFRFSTILQFCLSLERYIQSIYMHVQRIYIIINLEFELTNCTNNRNAVIEAIFWFVISYLDRIQVQHENRKHLHACILPITILLFLLASQCSREIIPPMQHGHRLRIIIEDDDTPCNTKAPRANCSLRGWASI